MNRYTLHVPLADNDGQPMPGVRRIVERDLIDAFGGFTAVEADGGWRESDLHAPTIEPVMLYHVDTPDNPPPGDFTTDACDYPSAKMRRMARYVKSAMRQDAVYLTSQPIDVEVL